MNYLEAWQRDQREQREQEARALEAMIEEALEGTGLRRADLEGSPPPVGV